MNEDKARKRIYWVEGITRSEVERSLSDRRPSRFRQQGPRRVLVVATAAVMAACWLVPLIPQPEVVGYLTWAVLLASLALFTKLRFAVRKVSDAPDELLDERQIAMRNKAYLWAYRWLGLAAVIHVLLVLPAVGVGIWTEDARATLNLGFVLLLACLPAMVLAWLLPGEVPE